MPRAIAPDDLFSFRFVVGADLSPDGTRVVLAQTRIVPGENEDDDEVEHSDLHLLDVESGLVRRLTLSDSTNSSPAISPDGSNVVFAPHAFASRTAKTAHGVIAYATDETVAVIDPAHAGKRVRDVVPYLDSDAPIVADVAASLRFAPTAWRPRWDRPDERGPRPREAQRRPVKHQLLTYPSPHSRRPSTKSGL